MASNYNRAFPDYPPLVSTDRWLYGIWMVGNDYRNKTAFYGAYPARYLDRVMSMFPSAGKVLHLFSGSLPEGDYVRFDLRQDCDVIGDAHHLTDYFAPGAFDLILADPPYSNEDAGRYGTPILNRNVVVKECHEILQPSGYLVWLDQVLPMYRKDELRLVGTIGLIRSTNHRFRVVSIFRRETREGDIGDGRS